MWGQKFGFVVGSALTFPFKQFSKVRGLYLIATLVLVILIALIMLSAGGGILSFSQLEHIQTNPEAFKELGVGMMALLFFAVIIAIFALVPFMVGIIRTAVTGEKADPNVLSAIFNKRQLQFILAYIKIFFTVIAMCVIGLGIGYLTYAALGNEVGQGVFSVILFFTVIAAIFVLVRLYFTMVLASLDKGTSLKQSWELSRNNWWLIFLSIIVVAIVVAIAQWLAMILSALITAPIAFVSPILYVPIVIILYLLIWLFAMMPQLAVLGYLYLIASNQVKMTEPQVKDKTAKS